MDIIEAIKNEASLARNACAFRGPITCKFVGEGYRFWFDGQMVSQAVAATILARS